MVPLTTRGLLINRGLNDRDQFFLTRWLNFTILSNTGGDGVISYSDYPLPGSMSSARAFAEGMIASTPNANARALSCTDEMRHVNFILGTRGATSGDVVRLFMQNTAGTQVVELATFRINGLTAELTSLNAQASLHQLDRLARATTAINEGATVSLATLGGALGMRSQIMTLSVAGLTPGCRHLGLDIRRAGGIGATSLVFPDLLVERTEQGGDRNNQSGGILTGNFEPYPTRAACSVVCPPCPPPYLVVLGTTFNFRNLMESGAGGSGGDFRWERGGGHGRDLPALSEDVSSELSAEELQARLLYQFRRAQVVMMSTPEEEAAMALASSLRTYGYLDSLAAPIALRNGVELSGNSTFRDFFEQTQWVLAELARGEHTPELVRDAAALSRLWREIYNE